MKMLKLVYVLLLVFTVISFSESIVYSEYHHADVEHCIVCHATNEKTSNLKMIKKVITTPNSGDKDVVFTARTGPNSFADGDADGDKTYDGICEVCHTKTKFHNNDGTGSPGHHTGEDCTNDSCHKHIHTNEFIPPE